MRNQFVNRISFFEPDEAAGRLDALFPRRRPAVLVGIHRDVTPPFPFQGGRLQRMRVIVVAPELGANLVDLDGEDAESLAEVLPAFTPTRTPAHRFHLPPRLVQGEILRGEDGALYERLGRQIRPLRRLVSGPSGEILEVAEPGDGSRAPRRRGVQIDSSADADETDPVDIEIESKPEPAQPGNGTAPSPSRATPAPIRALFPGAGHWRVVRLGDFKALLTPQLAHAERLRETHRLPCYAQVYEATTPIRLDEMAAAIDGTSNPGPRLQPLTHALAAQLQLIPLLPPPPHVARPQKREPGLLLPGEWALRLQLAMDPTADFHEEAGKPANGSATASPVAPAPAPQPSTPPAPAPVSPASLKTGIPEAYLKPWEFRISRDEALYDISAPDSFFKTAGRTLRRFLGSGRELRKWQVLLSGKDPEEQLWAVRPPRDGLRHPFVREWARRTLDLAGYDTRTMLGEWEVYWRRKGA
jgi:hypothetical protein